MVKLKENKKIEEALFVCNHNAHPFVEIHKGEIKIEEDKKGNVSVTIKNPQISYCKNKPSQDVFSVIYYVLATNLEEKSTYSSLKLPKCLKCRYFSLVIVRRYSYGEELELYKYSNGEYKVEEYKLEKGQLNYVESRKIKSLEINLKLKK